MTSSPFASRLLAALLVTLASLSGAAPALAQGVAVAAAKGPAAAQQAPDEFIKSITADVLTTVKTDKAIQSGDIRKVIAVVETKILPYVNFQRMTASAVGRGWRQATPAQRTRLQEEFKTLLIYTYAGAASQIKDETIEYKPVRARPEDKDVVVRTVVRGKGRSSTTRARTPSSTTRRVCAAS